MSLKDRFSSAWNAFQSKSSSTDSTDFNEGGNATLNTIESPSYFRQDKYRITYNNERSVLNSIFSRIANDVASIQIQHVRVDDNDRYMETIKSGLNTCMTLSANIDQNSRDFWMDLVLSMLDEGVVAAVPVDTNVDIVKKNTFDILSLRTGKVTAWYPSSVELEVYNDRTGKRETIRLPKDKVAIIENPFYSVMNEPNSTLKRLVHKMNILDQIDGDKASSKLNMLIQLPYNLKSPSRLQQAEDRRKAIEDQLLNSKYGVAYIDSTEKVTQLNRALENDLPQQISDLTTQLYDQIGFSADVFKGTANAEQNLIYNKRLLKPILDTIELEFTRKFLTITARTQGQRIKYFIDAFDLVTPDEVANMANSLSRNEVVSPNELRGVLGLKPNNDPRSDQLVNRNMPFAQSDQDLDYQNESDADYDQYSEEDLQDQLTNVDNELSQLDELDSMVDDIDSDIDDTKSKTEIMLEELQKQLDETGE